VRRATLLTLFLSLSRSAAVFARSITSSFFLRGEMVTTSWLRVGWWPEIAEFEMMRLPMVFLFLASGSAVAAPSVGTPVANPTSINTGQATPITVTCQIARQSTDPAVIANGVNLLRLNDANQAIATLGVMRDDGKGGDAVANDNIFTLQFTANEAQAGQIRLQCSAAFIGLLQRVRSAVTAVVVAGGDVTPPTLTISPADGTTITTLAPAIMVSYSDAGSGVDTTTFAITVDGINYTSQFAVGPSSATAQATLSGGQHVISASIKDKAGNPGQATSRFTIASFQSQPDATPRSGPIPLTVTFITKAIYTSGAITRWRWDYQGDGIFDTDEIGPLNHTFTFTKAGVYNAVLEVTNDKGQVTTGTVQITATNQLPTATAKVTPSNGPLPLTVTLTGTGTSANGTIVKYEWDRQGTGVFDFSSTTTGTTTFTYQQAGTYNAVFRVTDSFGQTATAVATATAVRVGPTGSPTAKITAPSGPLTGNAPLTVNFNGTGTPSSGRTIAKYEWDFNGDGVFDYSSATTPSTSFQYTSPGVFTAAFRVTDSTGVTSFDTVDITVNISATLTLSIDTLRAALGGTADVKTTIGGTTPVTILLKNKAGQVVRTLVSNVSRVAGSYTDTWDGKDDNGVVVPEGIYYAILQYKAGSTTVTVDLTNSTGNVLFVPNWNTVLSSSGQTCSNTFFSCSVNPFNNDFLQTNFTLTQAAEVNLDIRQINTTLQIVDLLDRRPFGRNIAYSLFWDGTDSSGKALQTPTNDGYLWGMTAYSLPTNGLFVENGPQLSNVTATPNYFDPATGDFISPNNPTTKINYTLSKPATVSLQVFRSGTNTLLRTITQSAQTGAGFVQWDGRADNGLFADIGDYHLALKAVDAAGNQSIVRYVSVRVFY
jgi:PKD repeat protein